MSSRNSSSEENKAAEFAFLEEKVQTRFEVIAKLGSGAYGHVWKVRCRNTGQLFAIKKVFLAFQNQTDAQRIYRQISLLSKIHHQNVVSLKQVISSEGTKDIYLLLQYLQSDVFRAIKNRVLDQTHKKYIVYQLATALNYLHSGGVLHRDLKPSNILINSSCQIKICDFGLSRTLSSQYFNKPIMTEFIATRWYRAPEVLLGSKTYSTKSDMWSLGCLIYELYSRRTLLPGQSTIDQISKMVEFKGKPTKDQIESLNAAKAGQIMSFFEVQKKPLEYYYNDLQCQDVKQVLNHLFNYNPELRWSAKDLMSCKFLNEFRDPSSQLLPDAPIRLTLNDNRRYKLERYRQEILNLGGKGKSKFSHTPTKRMLLSYRNNCYMSMHASTNHLRPNINTTLRSKQNKEKLHQSQTVSPVKYRSTHKDTIASVYCSARGSVLFNTKYKKTRHNNCQNSLTKKISRKYLSSKYDCSVEKGRQSVSRSNTGLKPKEQGKVQGGNKENYQNKQRLLKRQRPKDFRNSHKK